MFTLPVPPASYDFVRMYFNNFDTVKVCTKKCVQDLFTIDELKLLHSLPLFENFVYFSHSTASKKYCFLALFMKIHTAIFQYISLTTLLLQPIHSTVLKVLLLCTATRTMKTYAFSSAVLFSIHMTVHNAKMASFLVNLTPFTKIQRNIYRLLVLWHLDTNDQTNYWKIKGLSRKYCIQYFG